MLTSKHELMKKSQLLYKEICDFENAQVLVASQSQSESDSDCDSFEGGEINERIRA